MEVESKVTTSEIDLPEFLGEQGGDAEGKKAVWAEIMSSMPGMDEVLVFTKVIRYIFLATFF